MKRKAEIFGLLDFGLAFKWQLYRFGMYCAELKDGMGVEMLLSLY